jgi:hypothetical protein
MNDCKGCGSKQQWPVLGHDKVMKNMRHGKSSMKTVILKVCPSKPWDSMQGSHEFH